MTEEVLKTTIEAIDSDGFIFVLFVQVIFQTQLKVSIIMYFEKDDGLISFRDFFKVRKRINFSVILGL